MPAGNVRHYGSPPYRVAVLHGGPGAPGSVAAIARELSRDTSVMEPLQTADTVAGQVEELRAALVAEAGSPALVIGWSWGAFLGYLTAARHPDLIRKLVLVASPPFTDEYALQLRVERNKRLSEAEREEVRMLQESLPDPRTDDDAVLARLGQIYGRIDAYSPIPGDLETIANQADLNRRVWAEAAALRTSGELLDLGRQIRCPVLAIHGDHDPHPAEGVERPLSGIVEAFRFILLPRCGHTPWLEWYAREAFFELLREEAR